MKLLSLFILCFSISSFTTAQRRAESDMQEQLVQMDKQARLKADQPIDPAIELQQIVQKTNPAPDRISGLKTIVDGYASDYNKLLKMRKKDATDKSKSKQIQLDYRNALKEYLGIEDYTKLLTVIRVN